MSQDNLKGVGGWLLVYVIGSLPLLAVYSMGLSGWFFEYPVPLMIAIFIVLATPLALILVKSPSAPRWNIIALWTIVVLMTLRSISVFIEPGSDGIRGEDALGIAAGLAMIISVAVAWAVAWTRYFRQSTRVRATF